MLQRYFVVFLKLSSVRAGEARDDPVYRSQMLSLGGVSHLTCGRKQEGRVTCQIMIKLGYQKAVELEVKDGSNLIIQA